MAFIKGMYAHDPKYDDDKKGGKKHKNKNDKRKEKAVTDLLRKKIDRKEHKICNCNHHSAKNGKIYMDNSDPNFNTCRICGAKLVRDGVDSGMAHTSADIVFSILSKVRTQIPVDNKLHNKITKTLEMVRKVPEIRDAIEAMEEKNNKNDKDKKNKSDKKNKKKAPKKRYRELY